MLDMSSWLAGQGQAAGLIPPGSTPSHPALAPPHPPRLGPLYSRSLTVVVASAAWLAALRWPQDADLLVLGILSFAAATLGRTARRRRWRWHRWRWIGLHLVGLSASYN